MASLERPEYYLSVVSGNKTYDLKKVLTTFESSNSEKDLAQKITFACPNIEIDGKRLQNLIDVTNYAFAYYDIGNGKEEFFRGPIWTVKTQEEPNVKEIGFVAFDNLIYMQESKDSFYFSKGKSTKTIITTICKKWGISLVYTYKSINHSKQAIHSQSIGDTIFDLLEEVRLETGAKYVVRSIKGVLYISNVGTNKTIYHVSKKNNLGKMSVEKTMSDMVTKVVIRGPQNKSGKTPVKAVVNGDISKYGTLQEEIDKSKDTSMKKAKKEANQILSEKGKPFYTREIEEALDNPAIFKGDKIHIEAENISGDFIVKSIEHDFVKKTMEIEVY